MKIQDIDIARIEEILMQSKVDKRDVYRQIASEELGVPYDDVTAEQREITKKRLYFRAYSN